MAITLRYAKHDVERQIEIERCLRGLVKVIYESVDGQSYEGYFEREIKELAYVLSLEWKEV